MLQQNVQSNNNGFAYSPIVDAPYAMMPDDAAFDEAPPVYPPCPSDYEPAPAHRPETSKWQDELAPLTHTLKWVDGDRHEHSLTIRADDLDTLLIQLRTVKCFIAASKARARDEKPVSVQAAPKGSAPAPAEPAAEQEQAESAYDEPTERRVWCERHQTWLNRREKNGQTWYSHKTHEGWCRRGAK